MFRSYGDCRQCSALGSPVLVARIVAFIALSRAGSYVSRSLGQIDWSSTFTQRKFGKSVRNEMSLSTSLGTLSHVNLRTGLRMPKRWRPLANFATFLAMPSMTGRPARNAFGLALNRGWYFDPHIPVAAKMTRPLAGQ